MGGVSEVGRADFFGVGVLCVSATTGILVGVGFRVGQVVGTGSLTGVGRDNGVVSNATGLKLGSGVGVV